MKKLLNVQSLLWLALALALAGSLKHLAAIFASVDGNTLMGLLQAVAVDTGLFALSFSLRGRKAEKRGVKILWLGIVIFTGISVYGNYAYGLLATGETLPGWIVASRPIVLAASLPILVLYLAELVSDNQQHAARKEAKHAVKETGKSSNSLPLDLANIERQAAKQVKMAELVTILNGNPDASNSELASLLNVSRATVRNYKQELNGQVAK